MNNSMATATSILEPRMTNPAVVIPDAMQALQAFAKAAKRGGVPQTTAYFVHLRASQINGCSFCVEMHSAELEEGGEATSASTPLQPGVTPRTSRTPSGRR